MKLFYKKNYEKKVEEIRILNEMLRANLNTIWKLKSERKKLTIENKKQENIIDEQASENYDLNKKIKQEQGAKGGLTKKNNNLNKQVLELQKEVEDLKKKLEESMTDKYLVKKIPSGKKPNTLKTKVSAPMRGSVRKYMREEFE